MVVLLLLFLFEEKRRVGATRGATERVHPLSHSRLVYAAELESLIVSRRRSEERHSGISVFLLILRNDVVVLSGEIILLHTAQY